MRAHVDVVELLEEVQRRNAHHLDEIVQSSSGSKDLTGFLGFIGRRLLPYEKSSTHCILLSNCNQYASEKLPGQHLFVQWFENLDREPVSVSGDIDEIFVLVAPLKDSVIDYPSGIETESERSSFQERSPTLASVSWDFPAHSLSAFLFEDFMGDQHDLLTTVPFGVL
jgi:hypothetical protein